MLTPTRAVALVPCLALAATLSLRAQATNQRTAVLLPDGPGKAQVTSLCTSCHTIDLAVGKRATADEWRTTIQDMIDLGARIPKTDATAITAYLAQHFGPAASSARGGTPAPPAPRAAVASAGKDLLAKKCLQCHSVGMWSTLRLDRRGWEGVLYRMVGRGALWTEDEINAMADYLAKVSGPVVNK